MTGEPHKLSGSLPREQGKALHGIMKLRLHIETDKPYRPDRKPPIVWFLLTVAAVVASAVVAVVGAR